jgi:hypothetical protein
MLPNAPQKIATYGRRQPEQATRVFDILPLLIQCSKITKYQFGVCSFPLYKMVMADAKCISSLAPSQNSISTDSTST